MSGEMKELKRGMILFLGMMAAMYSMAGSVYAESGDRSFVRQEQAERSRERQEARGNHLDRAYTPWVPEEIDKGSSPISSGTFYVEKIELNHGAEELSFIRDMLDKREGRSMSGEDIRQLVTGLNDELMKRGYVTSRILIPEQNLSGGILHLILVPGRLGHVRYSEDSLQLPWRNAFPIREGDILNLRMLEQGLEQMRKAHISLSMRLLPGSRGNESDLELTLKRDRQLWGFLSVDDSGMKETGRYQWSAAMGVDSLTNSNDTLILSAGLDGSREGYDKSTRDQSFSYSIPFGKETFTIRHNRYHYHQTVASSPYDFNSEGKTGITRFTWDHMISRDGRQKKDVDMSIIKRDAHYFINHMEIPVQAMDTTAFEIGLSDRIYLGRNTLYLRLAHKQGMGWLGAQKENSYGDGPKTRYKMWLLDMDCNKPFTLGHRPASWDISFHGQWNTEGSRLYGTDMISIGNRYTVYGFDGEYTLMGESGWYLRNEISSDIPPLHSSLYLGLDGGAVYGPDTDVLAGRTIAGMALGLRGSFPSGLTYDGFISRSLYKPDGFHTRKWVPGFTVSCRF